MHWRPACRYSLAQLEFQPKNVEGYWTLSPTMLYGNKLQECNSVFLTVIIQPYDRRKRRTRKPAIKPTIDTPYKQKLNELIKKECGLHNLRVVEYSRSESDRLLVLCSHRTNNQAYSDALVNSKQFPCSSVMSV